MLSGEIARRYGSAGLPDDTIRIHLDGLCGPELRRVPRQGSHAHARRRRQRLCRQGTLGRTDHRVSAARFQLRSGRKHPDRQRRPLRRDQRRSVLQRRCGRALRGAQFRSDRGGRGRRRPRLRIHDQRLGAGARLLRPEFRRRHERRHRLCFRRTRRLHREALQPRLGRSGAVARSSRMCRLVSESRHAPPGPDRQPPRQVDSRQLGRDGLALHQSLPARIQASAGRGAAASKPTSQASRSPFWRQPSRCSMGKTTGFMDYSARAGSAPSGGGARERLVRDLSGFPRREASHSRARAAWIAACRSARPDVRSTISFPTGTIWSIAAAGKKRCASCTRPTISRNSPDASVLRRAKPRACWASTSLRSRSSRSKKTSSSADFSKAGSIPSRRKFAPERKSPLSAQAPRDWLRRSNCAAPDTRSPSTKKPTASADLLRYGIPEFKLEKHIIDRRLEQMSAEGVKFVTNADVGKNVPVEDLRREFDAIVLAGGSEHPRDLKVPGRELKGIHFAMEFLPQQNKRCLGDTLDPAIEILATGKRVVIIGGGDTGADCLGTVPSAEAAIGPSVRDHAQAARRALAADAVAAVADATAHRRRARRRRHSRLEHRHHKVHRRRKRQREATSRRARRPAPEVRADSPAPNSRWTPIWS